MDSWRGLKVKKLDDARIIISGIAYDLSTSVSEGASLAPDRMRELSAYLPPATKDGKSIADAKIYDMGNIGDNDLGLNSIYGNAHTIFSLNKFPIFLGGDHSVSIPIQKAFKEYAQRKGKIPAIIHIDAHPDFCDVYDDSKYSHACTNYRAYENGYNLEDIILIGIRGYELQEIELFANHPEITIYTATQINEQKVDVIEKLKAKFDDRYLIYLSFDIDAIDPASVPGTGTPEAFGLSVAYVNKLINDIIANLPVAAWDIVEVSPPLDINNITSWTALKIMYEVLYTLINKNK